MTSQDVATAAERLRARSLTVFPLVPNEKHPAVDNWQTADHGNAIRPNSNLGCFARDVFVIDFDTKKGAAGAESYEALLDMAAAKGAEPTYTQRTPTGGYHAFYRTQANIPNSAKTVDDLPGVDIRGTQAAGYVVGAGSVIDGEAYTVEVDAPIAQAPDWLVEMVRKRRPSKLKDQDVAPVTVDLPENIEKAQRYIEEHEGATEGERNDVAFKVAARLRDFGLSHDSAVPLMDDWNATVGLDTDELHRTTRSAFERTPEIKPGSLGYIPPELELGDTTAAPPLVAKKIFPTVFAEQVEQDLAAEAPYLIEGMFDRGTMIVVYGESNAGKTHVVLDQAFAIAAGRKWAGRNVRAGLVVYVAAEGGRGVERRIMAHKRKYAEARGAPFALIRHPVDLLKGVGLTDTDTLIASIEDAEARCGQDCVLVVIDTLARALAGGDENSSVDMGAFVKHCDKIRHATDAALLMVHHSGKNKANGARGWSGLRGAVDTELEVENNAIKCRKQRDMEYSPELRFDYEPVEIGRGHDGKPVGSVVLRVWQPTEFEVSLSPAAEAFWQAFATVCREADRSTNWARKELVEKSGISEAQVTRVLDELIGNNVAKKAKHGHYDLLQFPTDLLKASNTTNDTIPETPEQIVSGS